MKLSGLDALPDTFRFTEALDHMNERQFRRLRDQGSIIGISRGLYQKATWVGDTDLIEIASRSPRATLALRSALARHDLIDDIPAEVDIAIPRGSWAPMLLAPVHWHHFAQNTFDVGRQELELTTSLSIGIYSPERSIIDAFRLRHTEGDDTANEALKRWLKAGGQPTDLLHMARDFPRALPALRTTLAILL